MCKDCFPSWKKAVGLSLLFWLIMFVVVSIFIGAKAPTVLVMILVWLVDAVLGYCLAKWLYKEKPGTFVDGLKFGGLMVVIGLILDALLVMPFFILSAGGTYGSYFGAWDLWVGVVIVIVLAGLGAKGCCGVKKIKAGDNSKGRIEDRGEGIKEEGN